MTDRSPRAIADAIGAPISAMLPCAIVPLQHDFRRRIVWIEIDPGVKHIAGGKRERRSGIIEVMLMRAGPNRGLVGDRTGVGARSRADPGPGIAAVAAGLSAGRQAIIEPDDIG